MVYGKTSSKHNTDTLQKREVLGSLFTNSKTNTLKLKYTQNVSRIRSDFSLQYRSIDPDANTTVYGMMQSGNRRIAFETRHKVSSFLKLRTSYQVDESYSTERFINLKSTGMNISGNYKAYLTYSAMINYVLFSSEKETGDIIKGKSYLTGINLQTKYKLKEQQVLLGINYNDYLLEDASTPVKYTQVGISKMTGNRKWSTSIKYDYFFKTSVSAEKGTHVYGLSGHYNLAIVGLDAGIKISKANNSNMSYGGHLEIKWKISNKIDISLRGERFVMGDFYSNYYRTLYEQLPYLFTINTGFNF